MNEDTIVIALHGPLTVAEKALARSPAGAAQVRDFHRRLFADGSAPLHRSIKSISGMEVRGTEAEIVLATGSVVQLFTTATAGKDFLPALGEGIDDFAMLRNSKPQRGDGMSSRESTVREWKCDACGKTATVDARGACLPPGWRNAATTRSDGTDGECRHGIDLCQSCSDSPESALIATGIRSGMEVVGSCGGHVGVVDAVEDDITIRLSRREEGADGCLHYIPMCWVGSVAGAVRLNKTHEEARSQWHMEPFATSRPLG